MNQEVLFQQKKPDMTTSKKTYQAPSVRVITLESGSQILETSIDSIKTNKKEFVEKETDVLSTGSIPWTEEPEGKHGF